jgi:very-short-patch-repair endonuclease
MRNRFIVRGQRVSAAKVNRARELRQTMTAAEAMLWERLRANRLAGFHIRRQQVIDGFIVDFYCHAAQLVIELDGPVHKDQREYDAARDEVLARRGLQVVRFSNEAIERSLDDVIEKIKTLLPPTPPLR